MVVKLRQSDVQNDIEILITYQRKNKIVERIVTYLNSVDIQISCLSNDGIELVNASEILYVESDDNKTIINCEKQKYQVKERLYQIYEKIKNVGFIQISKYCIININKLSKIVPLTNSHLGAVLKNGKQLNVTRKYLAEIKQTLREM